MFWWRLKAAEFLFGWWWLEMWYIIESPLSLSLLTPFQILLSFCDPSPFFLLKPLMAACVWALWCCCVWGLISVTKSALDSMIFHVHMHVHSDKWTQCSLPKRYLDFDELLEEMFMKGGFAETFLGIQIT